MSRRERDDGTAAEVFKKETPDGVGERWTDTELGVRMLSHTANVRECTRGRGRRGGGAIGVGDGVDGA